MIESETLRRALDAIRGASDRTSNYIHDGRNVTTARASYSSAPPLAVTLLPAAGIIERMLDDTLTEYESGATVICPHCWDIVAMAAVIIGEKPNLDHWEQG